jgi:hypothetical protein
MIKETDYTSKLSQPAGLSGIEMAAELSLKKNFRPQDVEKVMDLLHIPPSQLKSQSLRA